MPNALYDVTAHALLSPASKLLTTGELDAQSALAEILLGLSDVAQFTADPEMMQAKMAVALQVNFQCEYGLQAAVTAQVVEGARSTRFREIYLHPQAERIAGLLTADKTEKHEDYAPLISVRGTGTGPLVEYPSIPLPPGLP